MLTRRVICADMPSTALQRVAILGAAATPVGRLAPRYGTMAHGLEHDILAEVAANAMTEAGVTPGDIDAAIFTQNPPTTRQLGFATFMMAQLGLQCRGLVTEGGQLGMTGGIAFDQAAAQVQLGQASYALALGVVRQSLGELSTAMDFGIRAVGDVNFQAPFALPPIGWYALDCARYMHENGVTRAQLAEIAVKSRRHASGNELAQFREPLTLEAVLEQAEFSLADVVRLNIYTTDVDALFASWPMLVTRLQEGNCHAAMTLLGVARLAFPELMVEIEATAMK